jgi:hypothetical protein
MSAVSMNDAVSVSDFAGLGRAFPARRQRLAIAGRVDERSAIGEPPGRPLEPQDVPDLQ